MSDTNLQKSAIHRMEAAMIAANPETMGKGQRRRGKGGRPKLPPCQRRGYIYAAGFNQAEYQLLTLRAQAAGMETAPVEFIRKCALSQPTYSIPAVNREALIELNKVGVNINQIARVLNGGGRADQDQVIQALDNLRFTIAKIGRQLSGLGGAQ